MEQKSGQCRGGARTGKRGRLVVVLRRTPGLLLSCCLHARPFLADISEARSLLDPPSDLDSAKLASRSAIVARGTLPYLVATLATSSLVRAQIFSSSLPKTSRMERPRLNNEKHVGSYCCFISVLIGLQYRSRHLSRRKLDTLFDLPPLKQSRTTKLQRSTS